MPASLSSYHLLFDVGDGLKIERMYLSTDADSASSEQVIGDLETLAVELTKERAQSRDRATTKLLELETQATLRHLSELCVGLEDAWKCELDSITDGMNVLGVTVAWREYRLGHWSSLA